jgi:hypothetical protein
MFRCQRSINFPTPWNGFSGDGERAPPLCPPLDERAAGSGCADASAAGGKGDRCATAVPFAGAGLGARLLALGTPNIGDGRRASTGEARPGANPSSAGGASSRAGPEALGSSARARTGEAAGESAGKRAAALARDGDRSPADGCGAPDATFSEAGLLPTGGGGRGPPLLGAGGVATSDSYFCTMSEIEFRRCGRIAGATRPGLIGFGEDAIAAVGAAARAASTSPWRNMDCGRARPAPVDEVVAMRGEPDRGGESADTDGCLRCCCAEGGRFVGEPLRGDPGMGGGNVDADGCLRWCCADAGRFVGEPFRAGSAGVRACGVCAPARELLCAEVDGCTDERRRWTVAPLALAPDAAGWGRGPPPIAPYRSASLCTDVCRSP